MRLEATRRVRPEHAGALLLAVVAFALYAPVLRALVAVWTHVPYYSYGFLVPGFSGWLAWESRREVAAAPAGGSPAGIVLAGAGLAMLAAGLVAPSVSLQALSIPVVVTGALLATQGPARTRLLAFPLAFLAFMTPLPEGSLERLSPPLQWLAAVVSEHLLRAAGAEVVRHDLYLVLPSVVLHVTEACNGVRFLLAMLVVGVAFAGVAVRGGWRRSVVVAAAVVLALASNWLRVTGTGVLAELYGPEAATGLVHVVWGKVVYAVALVPFAALVLVLRRRR